MYPAARPSRPGGLSSTAYEVDSGASMPVEMPCSSRHTTRITPDHVPTSAYVGASAMTRVVVAMIPTDTSITLRRPTRSATVPSSTPPSGRIAKPTANTASALSVAETGSAEGKKCGPR